ncbi:flagellin FliC [Myxococcota bacterium]|nr:flagellin FliC [Myxococcota bacterium]
MSLRINHNIASTFTLKNVTRTQLRLQENYQRLSSGLRINKAADDAAGLGVSESLRATIASAKVAVRNANDGISVVQTGEGALGQIGSVLSRMRELAVEAASETLADTERAYLETEFDTLIDEIDRLANVTDFNGLALIDGTFSASGMDVQVGVGNTANDRISITFSAATSVDLGVDTATVTIATATDAQSALTAIDTAIDSISSQRADLGAAQNRLSSALDNLATLVENLTSAESQIRDVDFAEETADFNRNTTFQQAGISVLAQANSASQQVLQLLQG